MKNIAQKSSALNTYDFIYNSTTKDYIDAISLNITYTRDSKIVTFNVQTLGEATINTIETSTLSQLEEYDISLLEDLLQELSNANLTKDIYINLYPLKAAVLTDENIKQITKRMNEYTDQVKYIVEKFPQLKIHLHSINRSILTQLKQKLPKNKIGFVIYGTDLTFIDVDYYVIMMNVFNDAIIDLLLSNQKEVILYLFSDYYIHYTYDHYFGEKSTPKLQNTFQKLGIISNYPEIIDKVFR